MNSYGREDYNAEMDSLERADQQISIEVAHGRMTGLQSLIATQEIELAMRKAKGALLSTVFRMGDADKRSSCNYPKEHNKGCRCRKLYGSLNKKAKAVKVTPQELEALRAEIARRG